MLILPIESEWLDMIVAGEKKEEYREIKPYWTARLRNYFKSGKPRTVRLRAGYDAVKSRSADVLCTMSVGTGRPEWGAIPGKKFYVLHIEEVIKVYDPADHLYGYHTVYLAGKITGDPNYVQKFADAEKLLKDMGYNVYNPAVAPEGMTREWYMRESFRMINRAEAVFFLPDWEDSEGAKIEYAYAKYIGKPIRRIIAMG